MSSDNTEQSPDPGDEVPTRTAGTRGRNPLTWLVAAAAVAAILGAGLFAIVGNDDVKPPTAGTASDPDDGQSVTELTAAPPTSARCQVPDAQTLTNQALAFAGTVQSLAGDVVVLVPDRFYAGQATDLVEVRAPEADLRALIGAVEFAEDGRYLVSATGGRVSVCGLSGPATPELEALYDEAFAG